MKKALTILLVAALMTVSFVGLASAVEADAETPYYLSITGTVLGVEELEGTLRAQIALPDADREARAYLNITDRTVFPFEDNLAQGDTVTAYYLANAPMIMIYPPQYTVAVLVNGMPDDRNVAVDRFNSVGEGVYLAQGGMLQFTVGEDTEIILADGTNFRDGDFDGRRIVVIYGPSTRSIPAQTTAIKLIVLFEDAVHPIGTIDPGYQTPMPLDIDDTIDASGWPILVNGRQITAPAAYQSVGGTMMLPLRAVAEALGYGVNWDGTQSSVRLGVAISLWIGNTEIHIGRMAPQTISAAPVLIDGVTFVPMDFFRAIGINNAYAFEGQIVIDRDGEIME
ncbi:MAG: copper amine oxidase N-terminal domain-containing protein [Oscillospiraceae bacterium]|nr:copper amine oxidase N-terminal domain-containing protein [Oscillospiraceae bacterium]